MNRSCAFLVLAVFATAKLGAAQSFTITFSDPDRPRHLKADIVNGSMEVTGWDGKEVVIENADAKQAEKAVGTTRFELPDSFSAAEADNVVTINGGVKKPSRLRVKVPHQTSLLLRCLNCSEVRVEKVSGDIDVDSVNSGIRLTNVGGSILAHSLNGKVIATVDGLGTKPSSFSSMNGSVDVTLPDDVKANIKIRAEHGKVYTDFEIKLQGALRTDRGFSGTINGGGPEVQTRTFNGSIYLRKKSSVR